MKRRHVPALDGIRGLAIIAVLMRHIAYVFVGHGSVTRWLLPFFEFGGWGVDLFFVLSGFLITGILIDTKPAINRARSFYGRRILRIFPVYYLTIAVVFIGGHFSAWIKNAVNLHGAVDHLAYVFYFQNFFPLWHHGEYPESILGPFWSLAVEEQFYFIWPMIVWRFAPRTIVKVCAGALCATFALRLILVPLFGSGIWLFAATPTRADGLFVGAALASILAIKGEFPKFLLTGMATAGLLALASVAVFAPPRQLWETGPVMAVVGISGVALLSGALIVFCLRHSESRLARVFQTPWLRSFGKYSYGIYVIHATVYHAAQALLTARFGVQFPLSTGYALLYFIALLGATYALAWVSFNCFESWFLGLKRYFEPVFLSQKAVEVYVRGEEVQVH